MYLFLLYIFVKIVDEKNASEANWIISHFCSKISVLKSNIFDFRIHSKIQEFYPEIINSKKEIVSETRKLNQGCCKKKNQDTE